MAVIGATQHPNLPRATRASRHRLRFKELQEPPTERGADHQLTQTSTPRGRRQTGSLENNTRGSAVLISTWKDCRVYLVTVQMPSVSSTLTPGLSPRLRFWSWDINSFPSTLSYSFFFWPLVHRSVFLCAPREVCH